MKIVKPFLFKEGPVICCPLQDKLYTSHILLPLTPSGGSFGTTLHNLSEHWYLPNLTPLFYLTHSLLPLPPSSQVILTSLFSRSHVFYSKIFFTTHRGESMVLTRLQTRLQRRNYGETTAESSESEVSFNPAWLDRVFLGRAPNDPPNDHDGEADSESSDMADDRNERRMQLLESAVMGMTEKFDELLVAVNTQPQVATQPPPAFPHAAPDRGRGSPYSEVRPTPVDPRATRHSDFVTEQLRREEFAVPRSDEGKTLASDMFIRELIPKPYMYLERPGLGTLKKKLDVRDTVSFHEYVICTIKMIRDPRAGNQDLLDSHLEHLQQVVQDAAVGDWPSVRRWSQSTFDAVERGAATWEDRYGMQIERLHHAIRAARPNPTHTHQIDRRDIPCKEYNAPQGCINNRSHQGRTVTFVHACSNCFSTGERAPHPACLCPRRPPYQPPNGGGQRQYAPPNQGFTPTTPAPKNAMQASLQPRTVRPALHDMLTQQ